MANGNGSEPGYSPLWYAVGAIILIGLMMGTILVIKPLEFKPPAAAHCEEAACAHGATSAEPEGVSHEHEAPPAATEHHEEH